MIITAEKIVSIMPACSLPRAQLFVDPLNAMFEACEINTRFRITMAVAQIAVESGQLLNMEENLNYRAEQLVKTWPSRFTISLANEYARKPQRIANYVYANRNGNGNELSGDGWNHRGRGCIGLTFKNNYRAASIAVCGDDTLLRNPNLVSELPYSVGVFGWFWIANDLNRYADKGDFDGVCDVVNQGRKTVAIGDSIGYADRVTFYNRTMKTYL